MDKEKHKEANKRYIAKHKEQVRAYHRKYRKTHRLQNREKYNEQQRQYSVRHREQIREKTKAEGLKLKEIIIGHYGGSCRCCGERRLEFLAIDHINKGGSEHRKKVGSGHRFYKWLKKNNFPLGFRVLCFNCNFSLGVYGYCPHGNISTAKKEIIDSLPLFDNKGAYA